LTVDNFSGPLPPSRTSEQANKGLPNETKLGATMFNKDLRTMINDVKDGRSDRRTFIQTMIGLGLTAPMATQILSLGGVAQAQSAFTYKPTKRGGGGPLKLLWWQGPTLLNPHFATGTKDQEASRLFYEPLASFDPDGNVVPVLAAEIPSVQNGGLAADGKSVTWKLRKGVKWHDGKPFTADDVIFTWDYARDPATATVTVGIYRDIEKIEKIDDHTVKLIFNAVTPFWANFFVDATGMILPKHLFAEYSGAKSREAPWNLKPVGTGPYKFVEFKPGDMVRGDINNDYYMANKPHFDSVEMKGGGDAVSAARAVIQTGDYDYAWNMQVEDEILERLEKGGKGKADFIAGGGCEFVAINFTDPNVEVDGERSSITTKHPIFSDKKVRKAISLLLDRESIKKHIYGRAGLISPNFLTGPKAFVSKNTSWEFNIDKASALLEEAGWKKGADGIREKDGKKFKLLFQTSTNAPRQKTQAIFKQAAQKAGIDVELKSVVASVFFSSDVGNPDTYIKFYADLEMFQIPMTQPDPAAYMSYYRSTDISSKANKWQSRNFPRWVNPAYDKLLDAAATEVDPIKRAEYYIKTNDMLWEEVVVINVLHRLKTSAISNKLRAPVSGWANDVGMLQDWYKEA